MKKYFIPMVIAIVLALAACNNNQTDSGKNGNDNNTTENQGATNEKEPLELQVLKADEEAGATIDNHNIYQELNKYVSEQPYIGEENDFSLYIVNTIHNEKEEGSLVLLGINRLSTPIKNISFDFTFGNKQGDYVWEKQKVTLDEKTAGILQPNSTYPVVLSLTVEQEKLLKSIKKENQVMEIENFEYDKA